MTALTQKAEASHKIKLFDTSQGQSVKFFNGRIESVELDPESYRSLVSHLRRSGWDLRPQVTSGGYVATRPNSGVTQ